MGEESRHELSTRAHDTKHATTSKKLRWVVLGIVSDLTAGSGSNSRGFAGATPLDFVKCTNLGWCSNNWKTHWAKTTQTPNKDPRIAAARSTAAPTKHPTTWYLQGRSEILLTPPAARDTVTWGAVGVIPTESLDGHETGHMGSVR